MPKANAATDSWCRNGIDRFVRARLAAAGIEPAAAAAPELWLRRASLTLTGLPARIFERATFRDQLAEEPSDAAYHAAVGRLFELPGYAEHQTAEWLDVARYADTYGYQSDVARAVWPWRDWVLDAYARNLPFDRFVTEQIAGDLLPGATQRQRLATAFQRLHRMTNEGGSVEEEMRIEYVADRTETFATAFLGMTMGCARCHDHKFDPISAKDYYALSSFFDDIDESGLYSHFTRSIPTPSLALRKPGQKARESDWVQKLAAAERELDDRLRQPARDAVEAFRERMPELAVRPAAAAYSFDESSGAVVLENRGGARGRFSGQPERIEGVAGGAIRFGGDDGVLLPDAGHFDRHQPFSFAMWLRVPKPFERAVVLKRSRAWTDAGSQGYEVLLEDGAASFALVHFWPGDAIRVRTSQPLPIAQWLHLAVTYDGSSRARGMAIFVDGQRARVDVIRDRLRREITGGGPGDLTLGQRFRDRGLAGGDIDELHVFDRELVGWEVAQLAGRDVALESADVRKLYCHTVDETYRGKLAQLEALRRQLGKLRDSTPAIAVMQEVSKPRTTYLRLRGAYDRPGAAVEPDTPSCLPPLAAEKPSRLALAKWLLEPNHPLTARVAVNRIWQMHFGRGLVATSEDFGTQGARPSHPQLLDWLARSFVDSGWDVQALHRLIVTSATFRQSSHASPELRAKDPNNELLGRGPRYQLAAETLRDQVLWASGLLVDKVGGPPVRPYQPKGLWKEKSSSVYRPSKGDGLYRRSLYTFWKRTSPPPAMMLLGASKRDVCAMRRIRTTTPLQALLMLNDPQFVEAARVCAEQLVRQGHREQAGAVAIQQMLGREARAAEAELLADAFRTHREVFAAAPERARKLLGVGQRPPSEGLDAVDVAAVTLVVQTVWNLDEVVRLR
ncbi:MAG: DUF1553 domain-containing protein [Planctomycetota bacterium]